MSWTTGILIFMALYGLLVLIIGPYVRRKDNAEAEASLKNYRDFCEKRDKAYPDMVGKWGKP